MDEVISKSKAYVKLLKIAITDDCPRAIRRAARVIANMPAENAREDIPARWVVEKTIDGKFIHFCSNCEGRAPLNVHYDFCPFCGANTRGS